MNLVIIEEIYQSLEEMISTYNFTGIVFQLDGIHIRREYTSKILENLSQNYVLINVHGNNCESSYELEGLAGKLPSSIELSYIHKDLIDTYYPALNQTVPSDMDKPCNPSHEDIIFEIPHENTCTIGLNQSNMCFEEKNDFSFFSLR